MKLRHAFILFLTVLGGFVIADNPPTLVSANGVHTEQPDRRKLHIYLLVDALVGTIAFTISVGISSRDNRIESNPGAAPRRNQGTRRIYGSDTPLTRGGLRRASPYFSGTHTEIPFEPVRGNRSRLGAVLAIAAACVVVALSVIAFVDNLNGSNTGNRPVKNHISR